MSGTKRFKAMIRVAEAAGWTVTLRHGGHLLWKSPTGAVVFTASTPSDRRAEQNMIRDLRHNGLDIRRVND